MTYDSTVRRMSIDPRGHLVERCDIDGSEVEIHYRDVPESDITTRFGLRVTTPLRTVIDVAANGDAENLALMVGNFWVGACSPSRKLGRGSRSRTWPMIPGRCYCEDSL